MRKKLDISLANQNGWKTKMNFDEAIEKTIKDFKKINKYQNFLWKRFKYFTK